MKIFKTEPNFQFMNKRYLAFLISTIVIAIGVIMFFTKGFNLGIDFTGGTNIEVSFNNEISENDIRNALGKIDLSKAQIQRVGQGSKKFFIKTVKAVDSDTSDNLKKTEKEEAAEAEAHEALSRKIENALRTETELNLAKTKKDLNNIAEAEIARLLRKEGITNDAANDSAAKIIEYKNKKSSGLIAGFDELKELGLKDRVIKALQDASFLGNLTFLSVEMVGPQVGHDLRQKATLATVWAMIGMLIYIAFRFRFIFGIAAVVTLIHDVLIVLTFIAVFNVEVSLSVVAGILTIVGYSLNDTIVIFDRVRDNLKLMKRKEAEKILDRSVNQTLSRTIVTSGTTLATVLALFFFGGEVIHSFSFTLMVGVLIGTYSSIFQSCAWLRIWQNRFMGVKKK